LRDRSSNRDGGDFALLRARRDVIFVITVGTLAASHAELVEDGGAQDMPQHGTTEVLKAGFRPQAIAARMQAGAQAWGRNAERKSHP